MVRCKNSPRRAGSNTLFFGPIWCAGVAMPTTPTYSSAEQRGALLSQKLQTFR